ncbi:hypothetical protein [Streptomyces sp. EN27]|uniref:hypothetical protein n=1 Tax=Streptomyces sp. EN27 TaxID=211464 RepID=UPI0008520164|nr:hypothetical protein [Streptomyces sp. EN27]
MSNHLTQTRIAAALAASPQPEGETPWHLLLTKPPTTHRAVQSAFLLERNEDLRSFSGKSEATARAEASRARIVQELARRDGYLDALSAAEHMLSTTPALPTHVDVRLAPWDDGPTLVFSFHKEPAAVHAFAAHFGTQVTEHPHLKDDVRVETGGTTESGIRFEAYTLVDGPAVAE